MEQAARGLEHPSASVRLRAALDAGIGRGVVPTALLIERCAVEEDFFVRDMLTWALTRRPADEVVPLLVEQLEAPRPQARSQALHTLSKIRDRRAWPSALRLVDDPDDEVARSAWRATVALVPPGLEAGLAERLVQQLGRGNDDLRRSLSRALTALGDAALPALLRASSTGSGAAAAHAAATLHLMRDPDIDFVPALREATRVAVLGTGPIPVRMLIGEVSRRSGVSTRMLRHYDLLGLVRPSGRSDGGYRTYRDADVDRLFQVEALRSLGLSLSEVGRALDDPGTEPSGVIDELIARTRQRIDQDREVLHRLQSIDRAHPPDWTTMLETIRLLRGLDSAHPALRQRAALAAGGHLGVPTRELVERYLIEDDLNATGALRWAIAARADAVGALSARLGSEDAESRRRVVMALTAIAAPVVEPFLLDALGDPDLEVRRRAATSLATRGRGEAVPVLLELVTAGIGDVEAAEQLGALAADDVVRARIVTALGALLGDAALPAPARHRVVQALAELRGPDVDELLRRLGDDRSSAVARTARAILHGRSTGR